MPPYRLNTSRLPPWARPPPPDTSWLSIPPESGDPDFEHHPPKPNPAYSGYPRDSWHEYDIDREYHGRGNRFVEAPNYEAVRQSWPAPVQRESQPRLRRNLEGILTRVDNRADQLDMVADPILAAIEFRRPVRMELVGGYLVEGYPLQYTPEGLDVVYRQPDGTNVWTRLDPARITAVEVLSYAHHIRERLWHALGASRPALAHEPPYTRNLPPYDPPAEIRDDPNNGRERPAECDDFVLE